MPGIASFWRKFRNLATLRQRLGADIAPVCGRRQEPPVTKL
jgi:hypothetical protein